MCILKDSLTMTQQTSAPWPSRLRHLSRGLLTLTQHTLESIICQSYLAMADSGICHLAKWPWHTRPPRHLCLELLTLTQQTPESVIWQRFLNLRRLWSLSLGKVTLTRQAQASVPWPTDLDPTDSGICHLAKIPQPSVTWKSDHNPTDSGICYLAKWPWPNTPESVTW